MLEVTGITLDYGPHRALDRVDLSVGAGEAAALLGPSGSGKTSLLRVIAGLEKPRAGKVRLDGRDITGLEVHERGLGLMFQDYALFPHLTAAENTAFGLRMQGRRRAEVRRRTAEVLSWVDMEGMADRGVETLSGGEQQRVALARALAPEPSLLMLDEPVGALDRALRSRLVPELSRLLRRIGVTAVYVTHDQDEAFAVADRVAVLHRGRIRQAAAPEEMWMRPADEFVARFLGYENIADLEVRAGAASSPWGSFECRLADGRRRAAIRPGGAFLDPSGALAGTVEASAFSAGQTKLEVRCGAGRLAVTAPGAGPPAGAAVRVGVDPEAVIAFPQERKAADE